jgi:chitinase
MSLNEIKQVIKVRKLVPKYLPESMMKQITWDDQWIGYDDEDTFKAKKEFADGLCFGGTMIWSIDFQETGDDDSDECVLNSLIFLFIPWRMGLIDWLQFILF